jgi:hypothetical protein
MKYILLLIIPLTLFSCGDGDNDDFEVPPALTPDQRLQPWPQNVNWWSWDGEKPILLLGGSNTEAPFLDRDWKQELNYLKKTGGNFVKTGLPAVSASESPFALAGPGLGYTLLGYDNNYWKKLDEYLSYALRLGIAVEIVVWDHEGVNNSPPDSLLWTSPDATPQAFGLLNGQFLAGEHPFFQTVPDAMGYQPEYDGMLTLQKSFIDQLLSISLAYRNIIYNVGVPKPTDIPWMVYWGKYIEAKAAGGGYSANINLGVAEPTRVNVARFNQGLIAGDATAFHRPKPNGNGMNGAAQTSIRGARVVERHLKFWNLRPAPEILLEEETIASAATDEKGNYLLYLPGPGSVNLSPDWDEQLPVRVTVVGYLGTQRSELLEPPYGDSFRLFTEEAKGGWMILEPQ